jgi:hypothetical protein
MRVIEKADIAPLEPLVCSIEAASTLIGRPQRWIFEAIANGKLQAVKSDSRTLVIVKSLHAYIASLPPATPKAGGKREPARLRKVSG